MATPPWLPLSSSQTGLQVEANRVYQRDSASLLFWRQAGEKINGGGAVGEG